MNDAQFQKFIEANEQATDRAIEKYVNGHLRDMDSKLTTHIEKHDAFLADITPVLRAYQGGKILGELVKWVAGVGVAYVVVKGFFLR